MGSISTIQIHDNVKKALAKLKETNESYEEAIVKMMKIIEKQKMQNKQLLKEGYKEMAQESLAVTKEWFAADKDW